MEKTSNVTQHARPTAAEDMGKAHFQRIIGLVQSVATRNQTHLPNSAEINAFPRLLVYL
jgi:hypothetical protein